MHAVSDLAWEALTFQNLRDFLHDKYAEQLTRHKLTLFSHLGNYRVLLDNQLMLSHLMWLIRLIWLIFFGFYDHGISFHASILPIYRVVSHVKLGMSKKVTCTLR